MKQIRTPIRRKLIFATLTPLCVAIVLCWMIGFLLITDRIFRQAQQKVINDLNLANKIYHDEIIHISDVVKLVGMMPEMSKLSDARVSKEQNRELENILLGERLSFLNLIDANGVVRYRTANPQQHGDSLADDPLVSQALTGVLAQGTQIYSAERLLLEDPSLSKLAVMPIRPTPHAQKIPGQAEGRGLVLVAVAPVVTAEGTVTGALQAGFLLNSDSQLVDTITRIVFDREGGGTATVFLGNVRVATNVRDAGGNRAIGTLMSDEVSSVVLAQGKRWRDRAFVLNDWFISAYEPIISPSGDVIGALYVGMPEKPLQDLRKNLNLIFAGVLLLVALIGILLSTWIGSRMARPVRALAEAARRMAAGERIEPITVSSDDEIGLLAREFNIMTREVITLNQTLEEKVARRTLQLEEKNQELLGAQKDLARAERLAGLGILAAGVAHEINNPLAVIRGNAELLQSTIPVESEEREEVDAIVEEATRIGRIVNNLREFSRSGMQRVSLFSVCILLDGILDQIGHQISLDRYRVIRNYWGHDTIIEGDEDQIRQVFTNLIINGFQAMPEGGELQIDMLPGTDDTVQVMVRDWGCGIQESDIGKLFTPFFTTKPSGTGLGLAISYGIIKDHKGEIKINSQPGVGSTFIVILPLRQQ